MKRPKLILDTSVCEPIATSPKREFIQKRLGKDYRLVLSPLTLFELSDAIKGGDGSHFDSDRQRLRVAAGNGRPSFVDSPLVFALKRVLRLPHPPKVLTVQHFEEHFRVIMRATNRDELLEGRVPHPLRRHRRQGLNVDLLRDQQNRGERGHVECFEAIRGKNVRPPLRETWVAKLASDFAPDLKPEQTEALADSLDAAYRYYVVLWNHASATHSQYNFTKNSNDWVDWQQLFYLVDPDMRLMVCDKKLASRCTESLQKDQIILYTDYLDRIGLSALTGAGCLPPP